MRAIEAAVYNEGQFWKQTGTEHSCQIKHGRKAIFTRWVPQSKAGRVN